MSTTQLGPFTLDHQERLLWRGSERVEVQPKVLDCIELLAASAGKLLSMERLRAALWPESTVGDDAVRQLIAKARTALRAAEPGAPRLVSRKGLGYVLECEVSRVEVEETPVRSAGDWPMVGRAAQLAVLRTVSARARAGQGGCCFLMGEAGAGKSTLIEALASEAEGPWLVGHCQAGGVMPAFWPFRAMARQLAAHTDLAIARRARQLEACWKRVETNRAEASAEQRLLVAQALCAELLAIARLRPLTLVLEDVHWADAGTLLSVELLLRDVHTAPLLLLVSLRPAQSGNAAGALLGRAAGRNGVRELHVPPLTRAELQTLLESLGHPYAGTGALPVLQQLTGGNALFVQQLLRHAQQEPLSEALPSSLAHVVMERVRQLPETTRAALSAAAVLGPAASVALLERVMCEPYAVILERLAPALSSGLLHRSADDPDQLCFAHALVCELLVQQLPVSQQRDLHARVVLALQDVPDAAARLAQHAFAAADVLPRSQTRQLCERAGRESFRELAFDQAVLHLKRALTLAPEQLAPQARAELALLYAQACWEADVGSEQTAQAFDEAATCAQLAGAAPLLAEAAIWSVVGADSPAELHEARMRQEQLARLERGFNLLLPTHQALRHRVARTLSWLYGTLGDGPAAHRWAREAAANQPPDDAWNGVLALGLRCVLAVWEGQRTEAEQTLRALQLQTHDARLTLREQVDARLQLMTVCLYLGDGAAYRGAAAELTELVQRLPQPPRLGRLGERFAAYALVPLLTRLTEAQLAGDLTRANDLLHALMAEAARLGLGSLQRGANGVLLFMPLLQYLGRCQVLQPMLELARAGLGECAYRLARAELAFERAAHDEAREHFAALRALGFAALVRGQRVPASTRQLAAMADLCVQLGTERDALLLYDALLPAEDFFAAEGVALSVGACARPLGLLAMQLGRGARAEQLLRRAIVLNAAMGHRPELARSRLALAQLLLATGREGEGGALRDAALAELRAMDMRGPLAAYERAAAYT